jgi:hypothetical protein
MTQSPFAKGGKLKQNNGSMIKRLCHNRQKCHFECDETVYKEIGG